MNIDLVGDIVQEKNLENCGTLDDLIKKFIEPTSLSYLKPMFEKDIAPRINRIKKEKREIVSNLLEEIPLNSQEGDIQRALSYILGNYIASDLEAKYDCIDSKVFELERSIILSPGGSDEKEIIIPLFAEVNFGESPWKFRKEYSDRHSYSNHTLNIESKAPPIPKNIKEKAKRFSVDYLNSISRTFEDPIMGNLLLRNYSGINLPNLLMYWIPSPEELSIKIETIEKDPILVAKNLGRCFLIDNWSVKGEQPYEHYLLEFKKSSKN
ncbi:MAG: hypothetical protein NTZ83_05365 [Candidatus Pacearchaeota archaeon]|nr:hypothetical protein [Candidatus Pacearchaeota archaeon]